MSALQRDTDATATVTADHGAHGAADVIALVRRGLVRLLIMPDRHRWFFLLVPLYALASNGVRALPSATAIAASAILYTATMAAAERRWPSLLASRALFVRCAEIALVFIGLSLFPGQGAYSHFAQAGIYAIFVAFAVARLGPRAIGLVATCAALASGLGIAAIDAGGPTVITWLGTDYLVSAALYTATLWLAYLVIGLLVSAVAVPAATPATESPGVLGLHADPPSSAVSEPDSDGVADIAAHRERLATMGEITAQVVHYLSSPLTGISTIVDDLLEDCSESERGPLELVKSEAERAASMVSELLIFTRRDESHPIASLNEVTERALTLFALRERSSNIRVTRELSAESPAVRGGPSQLEQLVLNLLDNAHQAINGSGPGKISVSTRPEGERVVLEVADNGAGIPTEIQPRIFEPFFTTKGPGVGTGLGLAIVARIVRDCGGEISVQSQPGCGTTFRISFQKAE